MDDSALEIIDELLKILLNIDNLEEIDIYSNNYNYLLLNIIDN